MADAALLRRCGNVTGWGAAGASAPWQDKKFPTEELVAFLKTISVHRCVCAAAPAPCLRVCLCRRENDDQLRACSPSLKKGFDDQHNGFLRAMKLQVLCARAPPALPMLVPQLASEHLGRAAHVRALGPCRACVSTTARAQLPAPAPGSLPCGVQRRKVLRGAGGFCVGEAKGTPNSIIP